MSQSQQEFLESAFVMALENGEVVLSAEFDGEDWDAAFAKFVAKKFPSMAPKPAALSSEAECFGSAPVGQAPAAFDASEWKEGWCA